VKMHKTRELIVWLFLLIVNVVLLFIFLLPVGAVTIRSDRVTHGSESAGLFFLGFFLIGLSKLVKRIKK
jgi:hypothetical protein